MEYDELKNKRDAAEKAAAEYKAAYKIFVEQEVESSGLKGKWVALVGNPALIGKLVVRPAIYSKYPYMVYLQTRNPKGNLTRNFIPVETVFCCSPETTISKQLLLLVKEAEA